MATDQWPIIYAQASLDLAPDALWRLNGDLTDSSGNGRDLSAVSGTPYYCMGPYPAVRALQRSFVDFLPLVQLTDPTLISTAGLTVGFVVVDFEVDAPTGTGYIIACGNSAQGGVAANNYSFVFARVVTSTANRYAYIYQHGANTTVTTHFNTGVQPRVPHVFHLRRNVAGTQIDFFVDGYLVDSVSGLTPPDGGSAGIWSLFGNDAGTTTLDWGGCLSDVGVWLSALSDADIAAEAARVSRWAAANWTP